MFRRHSCSNVMNLSGYNHEICGELLKGPKTTISLLAVLHNQIHRFGSKTQKDLRYFGRNHRIYGSHRWLLLLGESPEPGELAQSIKVRMSHRVKEDERRASLLGCHDGEMEKKILRAEPWPVRSRSGTVVMGSPRVPWQDHLLQLHFSVPLPGKNKMVWFTYNAFLLHSVSKNIVTNSNSKML